MIGRSGRDNFKILRFLPRQATDAAFLSALYFQFTDFTTYILDQTLLSLLYSVDELTLTHTHTHTLYCRSRTIRCYFLIII